MDPGFLLEIKDGNISAVTEWVEGPPEKGWFSSVRLRGKRRVKVETVRCARCGYLESYASE
jgi:hypothetical protein